MLSLFPTQLSQFRQNLELKACLSIILGLIAILLPVNAYAGVTGFNLEKRKSVIYTATFDDVSQSLTPRLDWRNPQTHVNFSIPESAWVENLDLLISAYPEGKVDPKTPLLVTFNDAEPIRVWPDGHGFDARISLKTKHIRAHYNRVSFRYDISSTDGCAQPKHGAWFFDLSDSQIIIKARTKARAMKVNDVKEWIGSAVTAPKSISIKGFGAHRDMYEAVAAQGISLNMTTLPKFRTQDLRGDMRILIGTRNDLDSLITDDYALEGDGPKLVITDSFPPEMVLTGDTHEDVTEIVKAFASHELPESRRRSVTPGELYFRAPFAMTHKKIDGRTRLNEIGVFNFDKGWGGHSQSVKFNVANPAAKHGRAVIKFNSAATMSSDSFVTVSLNNKIIGTSKLNARAKTVSFDIPRGLLQGLNNTLTIAPDLIPVTGETGCSLRGILPGFAINKSSFIDIKSDKLALGHDLSRLSASGYPFSAAKGTNKSIFLPNRNGSDRNAAMRLVSQMAKVSGYGWTDANFVSNARNIASNSDVLILGPIENAPSSLIASAPRGFKSAVYGSGSYSKTLTQSAALSSTKPISLLSITENPAKIKGGVAAIYPGEYANLIGIIGTQKGQSFSKNINYLLEKDQWNKLEGSVAKWNDKRVVMTQTALPQEYYSLATLQAPRERIHWTVPSFKMDHINLPELNLADRWSNFNSQIDLFAQKSREILWDRSYAPQPKSVSRETVMPSALRTDSIEPQAPTFITQSPQPTPKIKSAPAQADIPVYEPPVLRKAAVEARVQGSNSVLERLSLNIKPAISAINETTTNITKASLSAIQTASEATVRKIKNMGESRNIGTTTGQSNITHTRMTLAAVIILLLVFLAMFTGPRRV